MITNDLSGSTGSGSRIAIRRSASHAGRLVWIMMLVLGSWATAARADRFRYRYVVLDDVKLPAGFVAFIPAAIVDDGRVYGTLCDDGEFCSASHIAFYKDGSLTVLPEVGQATAANAAGTVGGVVLDPESFVGQAAIFDHRGVELIPPQPNEVFAFVVALDDRGDALIESFGAAGEDVFLLHRKRATTRLDFGPTVRTPRFFNAHVMNNRGIIAGTEGDVFTNARGFRFELHTGEATLLEPFPTEPLSWGLSVNNRGDVLGYSFVSAGQERIGVWDKKGQFTTYFVEGNHDFPTVSNRLLFNDDGLIVITQASDNRSYIVPRPGVRLDLTDLLETPLPAAQSLWIIADVNNRGSMIGFSRTGTNFLLERIGH